jgi:hypothetical protein
MATQTSVLRKPVPAELEALKQQAKDKFYMTQHGYDAHAFTDPKSGRAIGANVEGAYVAELVVYPVEIINTYLRMIEAGYALHEFNILPYSQQSVYIYFYRPKAQLDAALKGIYAKVEADYAAEIDTYNEQVIEREVQLHLATKARQQAVEQAKADQEAAAQVRKEVETALGAARKAVKAKLESVDA